MDRHNDILTNAQKIHNKIEELEKKRDDIFQFANDKADSISIYEKNLALTILRIKNGNIKFFEGVPIPEKLAVTLIRDVAKGICYKDVFTKEANEAGYKGIVTICECIRAELNGLQSINKHLE